MPEADKPRILDPLNPQDHSNSFGDDPKYYSINSIKYRARYSIVFINPRRGFKGLFSKDFVSVLNILSISAIFEGIDTADLS